MLKGGLALPGRRIVVAGSGPLLLAVVATLAAAGADVPSVIEASDYLGSPITADGVRALAVDDWQRTSLPGPYAAGETCGIGGADLAIAEGELAAYAVAARPAPAAARRHRARRRAFAELTGAAHCPGTGWTAWLHDGTDVCRCEEVPTGRIRAAVADLAPAPPAPPSSSPAPAWAGAKAGCAAWPSPA
ncbi:hypothetical protein BX285_5254 [Streptomyces sp. 1114.5]|uniref:hypothetical protein n=1 Tax=Streptomyces sp. 1114.5 TaxID=1938830 RepID=UPI000F2BA4BC|nr:hypothetical protein [Streptomyces sp. 1114.5]RKT11307.1 hypothetical protein BX285_5254 [Streptomyces sp. 1114.5]